MTRINLIPVEEISDQHLIAEYRELPRIIKHVLKGNVKLENIPEMFTLGKGHVRFFYNKLIFLAKRYKQIFIELKYRGFLKNNKLSSDDMIKMINDSNYKEDINYVFSECDLKISRDRIIEKIKLKPHWYKWSKREKPTYLN